MDWGDLWKVGRDRGESARLKRSWSAARSVENKSLSIPVSGSDVLL